MPTFVTEVLCFRITVTSASIVQVLIYMYLLTITYLHNKAAVVTKTLVKYICLGVQLR